MSCVPWHLWFLEAGLSSLSTSNSSGPVLGAQELHCHEGEGEKEAPQADDTAYSSFCASAKVPGFCLCFSPAMPGLSPGADVLGAAVKKMPCELEATAALLAGAGVVRKLVVPSARGARRGAESQVCPGRERAAASKLPCWGWASAPASLEARGPLQTVEPFPLVCALRWL